jgi:hypothetical protein
MFLNIKKTAAEIRKKGMRVKAVLLMYLFLNMRKIRSAKGRMIEVAFENMANTKHISDMA